MWDSDCARMSTTAAPKTPDYQRRAVRRHDLKQRRRLPFSGRFVSLLLLDLWIGRSAELRAAHHRESWDQVEGLRKILAGLEEEMEAALTTDEMKLLAEQREREQA